MDHYKMSIHHNLGFYTVEIFGQMNKRHNSIISLTMFLEAGIKNPNMDANVDHTSIVQILDLPYESPKEQFMLLPSISNFHKFGNPAMSELSSKSVISPSHITYAEHVLYDPFSKEDKEGNNIRKYIPVSPHNLIMYFLATFKEADMYHLL